MLSELSSIMKKTGAKKHLSLKTSSGKQQKISNFFIPSKATELNEEGVNKKDKMVAVNDKHSVIGHCERSLGENLCLKCLKKSPVSKSGFCSQCNVVKDNGQSEKERSQTVKTSFVTDEPFVEVNPTCKTDVTSSPDLIPATPPTKNKRPTNRAKRKFCFDNDQRLKKKCTSDVEVQSSYSNEASKSKNNSSKENDLSSISKKNIERNKSKNPFRKSSINNGTEYCNENLVKDAAENDSIKVPKLLPSSNERDDTDNCRIINLDPCPKKINDKYTSQETKEVTLLNENCDNGTNIKREIKNAGSQKQNFTKGADSLVTSADEKAIFINSVDKEPILRSTILFSEDETRKKSTKFFTDIPKSADTVENQEAFTSNSNSDIKEAIENIIDDSMFFYDVFKEPLRLDSNTRCKVKSVEHLKACGEVVLTLTPCDAVDTETVTCVLRGSWAGSSVSEGDVVSVTARPVAGQEGCWAVDNDTGLLVTHPDTLVSGTTVVGSLFCMRRSVLSDMYRGIDSDSPIMVTGSFLHQLLQEVLKRKVSTLEGITKVLEEFTKTRYFISNLYSSGMNLEKTMETLREFVPKIYGFVQKYLSSGSPFTGVKTWDEESSWNGTITDIADIEENIWSPSLGLKGKIDVTVKTSARNYKDKVMPLELKTGRASFSAEHRGQVILYTMMMSELGRTVDSGLLLYLREGVMKEVAVGAGERRDLMLLRNELVAQLRASHSVVVDSGQQIAAPALPPPIHHHSACAKCPYLTLCSAALRVSGSEGVSERNPLKQLSESSTSHLGVHHIVYVFHWTGLLRLEHTEALLNSPSLHHIWTMAPADRAKRGTCVPEVKLLEGVVEVASGSYQHVFQCGGVVAGLAEGDYVIVSSANRPAVAAGPITQLAQSRLTLLLERNLSLHQMATNCWYLDKYESQSGLAFNMTNLGCLLDNTEQAGRLRKAVIDVELPDFSPKLSSRVLKASVDLLSELNDQQRKAIFRALAADHYILIKGMPGTGKTATIAALVQLAVRLGRSVLVTSHTHSAVDNVLLRLLGKVDMLRLGTTHKLHPQLAPYGEAGRDFTTPDEMHTFYNSKSVVGVTCLGSSHPLLTRRQFDFCIVDEATQVLQPTVLRPLFAAHKFILIGDPDQLPPLVRSSKAKELGLGESLFARLDRPAVTTELSLQYRMNQTITDLANCVTYGGRLQCGSSEVASGTISLPATALEGAPAWVCFALSPRLDDAVVTVDTGVTEAVACINTAEADLVLTLLAVLAKGLPDDRVGVIAPYRAQVDHLRQKVKSRNSLVEVNTVDQYQGRDKDVIIYSCTRSNKPTESDILGDKNRLTVAITRARHKLIIIGNVSLLRGYAVFDTLFKSLPSNCIIPVPL